MKKYLVIGLLLLMFVGIASAVPPAYDLNTLRLFHFNGTQNSTVYTDETGHTGTTSSGVVHINTSPLTNWTKFGTGSLFVGTPTTSYLSIPYTYDLNYGTNSTTFDWWTNRTQTNTRPGIYYRQTNGANVFSIIQDTPSTFLVSVTTGGTTRASYTNTSFIPPPSRQGNHWAVVIDRENTTVKLYINGTNQPLAVSTALNGALNVVAPIWIGTLPGTPGYDVDGYFDEFRISNNSRWTEDFTPPAREYPIYTGMEFTTNVSMGYPLVAPFSVQTNITCPEFSNSLNWSVDGTWTNFSLPYTDAINITPTFTTIRTHLVNLTWSTNTTSKTIFGNATVYSDFAGIPQWSKPNRSISFVDMSTGGDLYNWSWTFGDGPNLTYPQPYPAPNASFQRNPTKSYQLLGSYWVNMTVRGADGFNYTNRSGYIRINMNNTFTLIVRDAKTFSLILQPVTVKLSKLGVDYTQNVTVNGVTYFELPDGSYDVMASAIPGVYDSNLASVTMAGTDATGTIYLTPSGSPAQSTWWTPHVVQVTIMDLYGQRLTDVTVNATYNQSSMPTAWIEQLYGIQSSPGSDMVNRTLIMNGVTGSDGTLTFTMLGSLKYDIYLSATQYGLLNYYVSAFPSDNMLNIYVIPVGQTLPTNANSTYVALNQTRTYFYEPDIYNVTMCIDYKDSTGLTTSVTNTWTFLNNNTVAQTSTYIPGTGLITQCFTLWNIRGTQVYWGYNATRSV